MVLAIGNPVDTHGNFSVTLFINIATWPFPSDSAEVTNTIKSSQIVYCIQCDFDAYWIELKPIRLSQIIWLVLGDTVILEVLMPLTRWRSFGWKGQAIAQGIKSDQ
jgi:hypothetical protein